MTPPTMSAATPASKALPPAWRISTAAAVVRGSPAETPAFGPITGGRWAAAHCHPKATEGTRVIERAARRHLLIAGSLTLLSRCDEYLFMRSSFPHSAAFAAYPPAWFRAMQ